MNRKQNPPMSPTPEDLTILKDDMIAFIEGHGMRRFHGYVDYDEVQCVMWETGNNPDGWKDFRVGQKRRRSIPHHALMEAGARGVG